MEKYGVGFSQGRIGNHSWAFDCHCELSTKLPSTILNFLLFIYLLLNRILSRNMDWLHTRVYNNMKRND